MAFALTAFSLPDFRIRGLAICPSHEDPSSGEKWLTSVASDGTIDVHRVIATQVQVLYNIYRCPSDIFHTVLTLI